MDDTCYPIYMKTQVTTLGLDNKYVRESKYRAVVSTWGCTWVQYYGNIRLTTNNRLYTILGESEMENVSI